MLYYCFIIQNQLLMKTLTKTIILLFLGLSFNSFSQLSKTTPFVDWTTADGSQQVYKQSCMVHNPNGNGYTYVAGANYLNGYYDIIVTKIDADGAIVWSNIYGSANSGDDAASAIFVDENDDVYVCGTTFIDSTNFNDFVLIKYLSNGTLDWDDTYNGDGSYYDGAIDMVYDQANQLIYVVGTGFNGNLDLDFITLQYDPGGTLQWNAYYDANGDYDVAARVLTDGSSVYVTGACMYQPFDWHTVIVEYDNAGNYVTHDSTATGTISGDIIGDFFRDTLGNIYITGSRYDTSSYNFFTVKYDTLLNDQWSKTYNAPHGGNDYATGVWVDYDGNVYVTGAATDTINGYDIHTLKYNASGSLVWTKTWNDTTYNSNDSAVAIIGDTLGNLYIIASSTRAENRDYLILKYDTAGNELWNIAYNGLDNGDDIPAAIAIEPTTNDIYVTGSVEETTGLTYLTLRLKEIDVILPQDTSDVLDAWDYTANLGQLMNTDTTVNTNVIYYNANSYPAMYFKNDAFSYVWTKIDTSTAQSDSLHRIDMTFEAGNTTKPRGYNLKKFYTNHYLGYLPESRAKVPHYGNLLYTDVWDYIDVECGSDVYGFKYFINVKPNGDTSDIQFYFTGQDTLLIDGSGNLLIISAFDTLVQPKPAAWEIDNSGTKTNLGWSASYNITGNIVSLTMGGSFNATKTLVLAVGWEPLPPASILSNGNLWWSTFYGGENADWGLDVTTDEVNESYMVGKTMSNQFFPLLSGYQMTFGGATDGFMVNFDQYAVREWATYFGGLNYDAIQGIAYNSFGLHTQGQIYVVGTTESDENTFRYFPISNPNNGSYYKASHAGNQDAFIARFLKNGTLSWSAYIGGASDDEGKSITIDNAGMVYISGNTSSTDLQANSCLATISTGNQFPLCDPGNSAYYQNFNAGGQDVFITSFDLDNSLRWSTLYGSDQDDKMYEVHFAKGPGDSGSDFVYVVGTTDKTSPAGTYNGSVPTNGAFPLCDVSGTTDFFQIAEGGFISRFTRTGVLNWATNVKNINSFQTVTNSEYEFYVVGLTSSGGTSSCLPQTGGSVPVCTAQGGFSETSGGTIQMYISKFDIQQLDLKWSSLYKGNADIVTNTYLSTIFYPRKPYDKLLDATTDDADNLYIIGSVNGTQFTTQSSIPSGMYYKSTYSAGTNDELADVVLLSFDKYNSRMWASYFGSDAGPTSNPSTHPQYNDMGAAITTYKTEDLYIVGYSGNTNSGFPFKDPGVQPTGNAYFQAHSTYQPQNWDAFYTRFDLQSIGVGIEENKNEKLSLAGISIYPNPTKGLLNVYFEEETAGKINIYNYQGQLVKTTEIQAREGQTIQLATDYFTTGVYFIQLQTPYHTQTAKFIKQ
jgi:hypothetical protein